MLKSKGPGLSSTGDSMSLYPFASTQRDPKKL